MWDWIGGEKVSGKQYISMLSGGVGMTLVKVQHRKTHRVTLYIKGMTDPQIRRKAADAPPVAVDVGCYDSPVHPQQH